MAATKFLSIYTPSNHEPEDLEHLLVGRHALLERIVSKVGSSGQSMARHHQLVIGPRGIGKTHLVSLVHHRLSNLEGNENVLLAWLREDAWGLSTFDKLVGRILQALDAEVESRDPVVQQLKDRVGSRTLIVIVENLDDVFRRIKPEGQRALRSLIQEWEQVVIVAATPSLFDGVSAHDEPFYGFFEITHLEELTLDEAAELLANVSDLRGNSAMRASVRSVKGRQRLQVIRTLAGGHPRIWMLFADCLDVDDLDELVPRFMKSLDDLMPYYQSRMKELEGQQEEIVATLCEQRGAIAVKDLAQLCDLKPQTAASQLAKLQEKGYVRKVRLDPSLGSADERESYFELREPLMRLCLDVKDARAKPIKLIVEFLRHWFDEPTPDLLARLDDPTLTGEFLRSAFGEIAAQGEVRAVESQVGSTPFGSVPTELVPGAASEAELLDEWEALQQSQDVDRAANVAFRLGVGFFRGARFEEAERWYVTAFESGHADAAPMAAFNLGSLCRVLERFEEAERWYVTAFESGHADQAPMAAHNLGCLWFHLDSTDEALDWFRRAEELAPTDPSHVLDSAEIYLSVGDLEQFSGTLCRGLQVALDHPSGYWGDTEAYCKLLTDIGAERSRLFISELIDAYSEVDRLGHLGAGLVKATPALLALSDESAESLMRVWEAIASGHDEMLVSIRIIKTALKWKRDGKRTHLMRLPKEERELLIPLLEASATAQASASRSST